MTISSNVTSLATKIGTEIKAVKQSVSTLQTDTANMVRTDQTNVLTSDDTDFIVRNDTDSGLSMRAAPLGKGACLDLCGNDVSGSYAGAWQLSTVDGSNVYNFRGGKDGSLTFRNKNVVRSVNGTNADTDGNVVITLPTKTSELTNDSNFLTAHQDITGKADKAATLDGYGIVDAKIENGVITLGSNTITPLTEHQSLTEYAKTESIPTKVSDLDNDAGYLTAHQDISGKADASSVYTKDEVDTKDGTKVNLTGSRGSLAGYETVSNTAFTGTVNAESPDSLVATGAITIEAGTAGTSFTKVIRTDSEIAVTLADGWAWNGGEAPTIVAGGILVACWCGSSGMVSYASPSA